MCIHNFRLWSVLGARILLIKFIFFKGTFKLNIQIFILAGLRPANIYIYYHSCYTTKLYLLWEHVKIALRQNCTKTNLHEMTKFYNQNFSPRVNFERRYFCSQTNLHKRTKLSDDNFAPRVNFHELQFCTEGHFWTRVKNKTEKLIKR